MTVLTISIALLSFLSSFEQSTKNNSVQSRADTQRIDTSNYAILTFDTAYTWIFENVKPSTLTAIEIEEVENILKRCVDNYNPYQQLQFDTISKAHPEYKLKVEYFIIELSRYRRQYVPVINSAGQKEVWVNCFCRSSNSNWRKHIVHVHDGGNCYFSVSINLSTKTFSRFIVNGNV